MKSAQKVWLEEVPWESLVEINKALCKNQQLDFTTNAKGLSIAKQCWEAAVNKSMTLAEVLEVCRKCYDASPFMFNNGNTFGSVAKTFIQEWLNSLPPLEAEIVRATVSHYVVGLVGRRELGDVLKHFEPILKRPAPKAVQPQAPATPQPADSTTTAPPIQRTPASQAV